MSYLNKEHTGYGATKAYANKKWSWDKATALAEKQSTSRRNEILSSLWDACCVSTERAAPQRAWEVLAMPPFLCTIPYVGK